MKKIYLSLLSLMLICITNLSIAQINFGPRVGLNIANVAGVNVNTKSKIGAHIGGYVKLNLTEKIRFQPELLFSMKGYTAKGSTDKAIQSLNYIDVPLMFGIGGDHFRWLIGAQYSMLLSGKYTYKPSSGASTDTENKDWWKGSDIAFLTGFEYELDGGLNMGFRFSYGFPNIYQPPYSSAKLHSFLMQFTVGYTLGKD